QALLDTLEIHERVVLRGVEFHQTRRGRRLIGQHRRDVARISEPTITVVHAIRALGWKTFLITLPTLVAFRQLIGDGLANNAMLCRNRTFAIDVDQARRARIRYARIGTLVRKIDRGGRSIGSGSCNGAHVRARGEIGDSNTGGLKIWRAGWVM